MKAKHIPLVMLAIAAAVGAFLLARRKGLFGRAGATASNALAGATTAQGALAAVQADVPQLLERERETVPAARATTPALTAMGVTLSKSPPVGTTASKTPSAPKPVAKNPLAALPRIGIGAKPTIAQSVGATANVAVTQILKKAAVQSTAQLKKTVAAAKPAPKKSSSNPFKKLAKVATKSVSATKSVTKKAVNLHRDVYAKVAGNKLVQTGATAYYGPQAGAALQVSSTLVKR